MADSDSTSTTSTTSSMTETEYIEITIGGIAFTIAHSLIAGRSPLLDIALEECDGDLTLLDADADVFRDYLCCLEDGAAGLGDEQQGQEKHREGGRKRQKPEPDIWVRLADVWIFAEMIQDLRTANEIADAILDRHEETQGFPSARCINAVFLNTGPFSPLRRLIVDLLVLEAGPADYEELRAQEVTPDLWYAVSWEMKGLVAEVKKGPGRWEDALGRNLSRRPRCDWHFFDEDGCASCGRG